MSREEEENMDDSFPYTELLSIKMVSDYFTDIVQFLNTEMTPSDIMIM
jgi:hypothetical protein